MTTCQPPPPITPRPIDAAEAATWRYADGTTESHAYAAARRRRMAEAYAAGQTAPALAALFGMSEGTVLTAAREHGVNRPAGPPVDAAARAAVADPAFAWGPRSDGEVARALGVCSKTVSGWRRAAGVPGLRVRHPDEFRSRLVPRSPWGFDYEWGDKSDAAIAAERGVTRQAVAQQRKRCGVPPASVRPPGYAPPTDGGQR